MQALALYRDQPAGVRFHTAIRAWSAPLEAVVAAFPPAGRILEVGCGHGLVSNELALRNPHTRVLGVDVAESKIASAAATVGARPNIAFRLAPLEAVTESGFDAVGLIDVLYLVPIGEWRGFLEKCRNRLKPGGVFVLKEISTEPRWKFERLRLQELVSTRILRITKGEALHFESLEGLKTHLLAAGFDQVEAQSLDRGYTSPHVLLTARAPR